MAKLKALTRKSGTPSRKERQQYKSAKGEKFKRRKTTVSNQIVSRIRKIGGKRAGTGNLYFYKGTKRGIAKISDSELERIFKEEFGIVPSEKMDAESFRLVSDNIQKKLSISGYSSYGGKFEPNRKIFHLMFKNLRKDLLTVVEKLKKSNQPIGYLSWSSPVGLLTLKIRIDKKGFISVIPSTATHATGFITGGGTFDELKTILREGFNGKTPPNVDILARGGMGIHEHVISSSDVFALELSAPMFQPAYVRRAAPNQITRVNIKLRHIADEAKKRELKAFYRREITQKFGVPVKFIEFEH